MRSFEWPIESILAAHSELYLEHCAVMAVALLAQQSASPCDFLVQCEGFVLPTLAGESSFLLRVVWDEQTAISAARVWFSEQTKPIVERAAVALTALLFTHLLPEGQMRVTQQGERADYWLPRLRCVVEMSGTQQTRELRRRERTKIAQALANPRRWNAYVVICCFSAARRCIRWSYHTQEEPSDAPS